MRNSSGILVPQFQFPNIPLSQSNVLYFFERVCSSCYVNLTLTYPNQYSKPLVLKIGSESSLTQERTSFPNGIHWLFLDAKNISLDFVRIHVQASVNGLPKNSLKIPPKLSLIATQDFIDSSLGVNGMKNSRSVYSTFVYNQTLDCSLTRMKYSNNTPAISITVPDQDSNLGTIWKFGFYIDPSYQYSNVTFDFRVVKYSNVISFYYGYDLIDTFGDFYFVINSDQSWNFSSELIITLDNSLQIFDRFYNVYVKVGQKPTVSDYDMKVSNISFYNSSAVYTLRYYFSNRGTFTIQGSDIRMISNKKLDSLGQKFYLFFEQVPGSIFTTPLSCLPQVKYNYPYILP